MLPPGGSTIGDEDGFRELWASVGLTDSEIETYEFLLHNAASTATAASKATRHSRGRTYQTLRSLVERGLVREHPAEPVEYAAVEPAEIIDALLASSRRRENELQGLLQRALGRKPQPASSLVAEPPSSASVFRGRRALAAEVLRLVDGAKQKIWIAGGGRLGMRIVAQTALVAALRGAMDRGVDVAIAAPPQDPGTDSPNLSEGLAGVRFATLPWDRPLAVNLFLVDGAAVIAVAVPDDGAPSHGDDFGVRLQGIPFASGVASWIDALVRGGSGTPALADGLSTRKALFEAVRGASKKVDVMGSGPWIHWASSTESGLMQVLLEGRRQGVVIRVLTELDPIAWRSVKPLLQGCEVRAAQTIPMGAVVIDDQDCFVEVPAGRTGDEPALRRSTDSLDLRHVSGLFERFWNQGAPLAA